MTSPARNETSFLVMGETYHVRPTFKCVGRIEGATGEGVMVLGQRIVNQQMPLSTFTVILHSILATDENIKTPKVDDLGEWLMEEGVRDFLPDVANFLLQCWQGSGKPRKTEESSGK